MPTPRWSILFRRIPRDSSRQLGAGGPPGPRLDSDRQAVDRGLGHDPGAGGADSDRIAGRTTRAVAARLLLVDLGAGLVRAAAQVPPPAVAVNPGVVIEMAEPVAGSVRIRRPPVGRRRALAVAGRGVADRRAGDCQSRPEPVPPDAQGVEEPRPARAVPARGAVAGGRVARAGAHPAA